jgi:hypothetical protein
MVHTGQGKLTMRYDPQKINDNFIEQLKLWEYSYPKLVEVGFDPEADFGASPISLRLFDIAVRGYLTNASSMNLPSVVETLPALILAQHLDNLEAVQNESITVLKQLANFFKAAESEELSITLENNLLKDSGGRELNIGNIGTSLYENFRKSLTPMYLIFGITFGGFDKTSSSIIHVYEEIVGELRRLVADAASVEKEAIGHKVSIEKNASKAETKVTEMLGLVEQVESLKEQIVKNSEESTANASELQAKLANVREISADAETLKTQVRDYQSQFDAFDKQLQQRLAKMKEFEELNSEAQEQNLQRESDIDELNIKASEMMEGATIVGLSKAFHLAGEKYGEDADKAKKGFYTAIFVLVLSVLPLVQYVVQGGGDQAVTISGVLSRILILLPGAWLTTFAGHRYSSLFQLHREYAFKAAIAMSLEGFKKQAPGYEEEIAGAAFLELTEKPEYGPKYASDNNPNPILKHLIATIEKRLSIFIGKEG